MAKDSLTPSDYLRQSKSEKISALILLGTGIALIAVVRTSDADIETLGLIGIVGIGATIIGIPILISSAINKHRAVTLSVKEEKAFILYNRSFVLKPFPDLDH